MYLSTLQIRNFRNYDSATFKFSKGTNTIIGENDSGKTNALTALRILLDDSYYYSNKTLKESDFFDQLPSGWQGEWIIISATFDGITEKELENEITASISIKTEEKAMEEENVNEIKNLISNTVESEGSITLYIRPNKNIRKKMFDAQDRGDYTNFDEIRESIRLSDYEFFYTSKSNMDFSVDENYDQLVGFLEWYEAVDPEEDDEALLGTKIDMTDIFQHISVVYVDALRDVLREMKNNRNPLRKIVGTIESQITLENIDNVRSIIQNLNQTITEIPEIKHIGKDLNYQLESILGSVYSPQLLLSSNLSDDMSSLAKFLSMKTYKNEDLDFLGLGHLNMIYLALKIVEFETSRSRELLNVMVVEEPEAHIHHHIQKTLFEGLNLKDSYTQIIMTTHSVHLAESSEISRMNVLKSSNSGTSVMHPSVGLESFAEQNLEKENLNLIKAIERYLDVKRNGLLFSKGVVLIEGDAEEILIPQIIRKAFGVNLDELGIGLINLGSTAFEYIASLFHDDRINRKCAIITDLDKQAIPENHALFKKTAEEKGMDRKDKLIRLFGGNDWINISCAYTTFELEFIESNVKNIGTYIKPILKDTFKKESTVAQYLHDFNSEDNQERNLAMLKLAQEVGKGWLSIEIGQNIDYWIKIPAYIMDAIAFACQETIDISVYKKIVFYVLNMYDDEESQELVLLKEKVNSDIELEVIEGINEFLEYFNETEEDSVYFIKQVDRYNNYLNIEGQI